MAIDLKIRPIRSSKIGEHLIHRGMQALESRIQKNGTHSISHQFTNQLEGLRSRLKERGKRGESFEKATDVVGRERLLLQLYSDRKNQEDWLPSFDEEIAKSVLGDDGRKLPPFRRSLAALLYFNRFSQLPAKDFLATRLQEAYSRDGSCITPTDRAWNQYAAILFAPDSLERVAASADDDETFSEVLERLHLTTKVIRNQQADFLKCLKDEFLVLRLMRVVSGKGEQLLSEFHEYKDEPYQKGMLMGAKALQVLVRRVIKESGGKWPGIWPQWIVSLGCDPRFGRDNRDVAKWWGWATNEELAVARQGITGLTLKFFIDFLKRSLEETSKFDQFQQRSDFLMRLFEAGIIQSARLILNNESLRRLDQKHRDIWSVARLDRTTDDTSMVCLECIDNIYLIEGTHSFALRAFRNSFPIIDFWKNPRGYYQDNQLRVSDNKCDLFLRHDPHGGWRYRFKTWLRQHHIEWNI